MSVSFYLGLLGEGQMNLGSIIAVNGINGLLVVTVESVNKRRCGAMQ